MKSIRQLRVDRGWTQYELAAKVGVQAQAVYLWESGKRTPQVPQMRKLGEIFGICSDQIDLDSKSIAAASEPHSATHDNQDNEPRIPNPDGDFTAS